MKEKINKRTTKDSIEYLELQCIVNNRIHDYVAKYHSYPKYIKLPLWIFECLKQTEWIRKNNSRRRANTRLS